MSLRQCTRNDYNMKSKKLLSLILSTCLLSPAYQPLFISAEENQTFSGDICTKNPEYEARREAVAEAEKDLKAAGAEKDAAVKAEAEASSTLSDTKDAKTESEKKLDEANKALDKANGDVENAEKTLETVKSDAVQADTDLDDAKKAEQAAQKALDGATQAKKDAEQARDTAKTADDQAKTDVENAEKAVEDAKAALEKARPQETASALGFFESLGTQDARDAAELLKFFADINNYSSMSKDDYDPRGVTVLGGEKDATNLDLMLKAIQMMRIGNEKRAEAGVNPTTGQELSDLKVSVVMWAQAMAYANMEAYTEYHWFPEGAPVHAYYGENLALGRIDHAYEGWYDEEKELYDFVQKYLAEHPGATEDDAKDAAKNAYDDFVQKYFAEHPDATENGAKAAAKKAGIIVSHSDYSYGHYTTLLDNDTATGFGYTTNYKPGGRYRGAATQQFGDGSYSYDDGSMYGVTRYSTLYSLDEMETLLTGYKNSIDAKIVEAQANLDKKQAELEAIMAKKETTAAQLKAAIDAVTEAATRVTEAKSDLGEKTGNREKLEAIASEANAQIAAQETVVSNKKTEASKKADAARAAQADVDARDAAVAAAQSALDAATANVKAKEMSVEKAKADLKTAQDALNATGHTWKETVVKEPSCTTEGLKKYTCENCGETKQETLSALGHDYSKDWTIDKEATCEEPGEKSHHCTKCNNRTDITVIDPLGHAWKETIQKPTCTEGGTKVYTCENCGETKKETLPALGHDYAGEWTVDKEATYYEDGSKSHHCSRCDDITDVTVIPRLSFADVNETTDHYDDVLWLATNKVTAGWDIENGQKEFRPYVDVARCDMAAFIRGLAVSNNWLDAATWTPDEEDWNTFTDIDKNSPHAEDVLWLAHTGISEGWNVGNGKKEFRPLATVARCDMAAFLQRLANKQGLSDASTWEPAETDWIFADIDADTPHAKEVLWLAHSGVSKGWSEADGTTTFRPLTKVARCDMAAFLRRLVG